MLLDIEYGRCKSYFNHQLNMEAIIMRKLKVLFLVAIFPLIFTVSKAFALSDMKASIRVSGGTAYDYFVIGMRADAGDGFDNAHDTMAPGRNLNETYIYAYLYHPEWGQIKSEFRGDFRSLKERDEWIVYVYTNLPAGSPLVMSIDETSVIPPEYKITVQDMETGSETEINSSPYYFTVSAGKPLRYFKVVSVNVPKSVDTTPPTTSVTITGTLGINGWYVSDVNIYLSGSDAESGIGEVHYTVDGSADIVVPGSSAATSIDLDGAHTLSYYSVDGAGNKETLNSLSIKIDKTRPKIALSMTPDPNATGWYNTDVTVSFTCSDSLSGIAVCPAPITVATEGAGQIITGSAVDGAGNEAIASVTLDIDKTPPVADISASPAVLWPPKRKMVQVAVHGGASDSISGIVSRTFTVKDEYGKVQPLITGFDSTIQLEAWRNADDMDGRLYTITAVITDDAGNKTTASTEVVVPHDMRQRK